MQSGEEDMEVAGAQSGVDALLIIGERKPDLVVLDIMMPGMDGIEVCQRMKSSPVTRNLRIVAISGDHDPTLRSRVLAAGADLFFTKPFDMILFRDECLNLMHLPRGR
jgi:CheY-like chemotaxis protein